MTKVVYCTAHWAARVTEAELREQIGFFQKYIGVDKVYLEAFRDELASRSQIALCKRVFAEHGIAVAGGITTITRDLDKNDKKRQRLFNTFCYTNPLMREHLIKMVEETAAQFDEFIIDDFFFTQCTCEDCQKEKGDRSWEEFRLEKMREVSENLVIKPAKAVNPAIKITIKYPNWMESYQETGYNLKMQKDMFDRIYTGTETRHESHTDQHLPRYLSYSIMRYMENTAPQRNGGGWLDAYECYPIDCYLEQAYLTAFSKPSEIMLFSWSLLYNNKLVTPLGFQLQEIETIMAKSGPPTGFPVYLPYNAQGEDHLEDYLGMIGIPFEPTPDFPEGNTVFLTAQALHDPDIISKLTAFLNKGGKAIVSSGFMLGALAEKRGIEALTSIRYRGRHLYADEYHISRLPGQGMVHRRSAVNTSFPLLEHRNNASWSFINAGHGGFHGSIFLRDTVGRGELFTLVVPDQYSALTQLPQDLLNRIRSVINTGIYITLPAGTSACVSLFTYDSDMIGLYSYTTPECAPEIVQVHTTAGAGLLEPVVGKKKAAPESFSYKPIEPLYKSAYEAVFEVYTEPGQPVFYKVLR
ncbi:MAG: hypothetical protein LBB43_04320 [Spirochaetaceae bacterium]|jgi:hypothetical protein|nr:hypothetical protein [Spirochaetaceae bacterium]